MANWTGDLLSVAACGVILLLGMSPAIARAGGEQGGSRMEPQRGIFEKVAFGRLQARAREAKSHEPSSVRAMVDEIFASNLLIKDAPESLRERVTKGELAMRKGDSRGISVANVVRGINEAVGTYGLQDYFRTSEAQIQTFRSDYRYIARDLALPSLSPGGIKDTMTPSEALFIGAELVLQKVLVEENRISPEAWDKRREEREREFKSTGKWALGKPDETKMSIRVVREERFQALDFSSEEAPGTVAMHRLLDTFGLQR